MIHDSAEVHPTARIGPGTKIWHQAQVREGAQLGANCIVGK
ncbi:MAG: N-acetyltransferase, partial [Anaerolineae bacterium]|nr:N-acetyltransferase [Anaerolineae bacterium]